MRYQGRITKWKDDEGYGFITPKGGGEQIFVHIKSFPNQLRRPVGNDPVSYNLRHDAKGRAQAENVAFMLAAEGASSRQKHTAAILMPVLFIGFIAASVLLDKLPAYLLLMYLVASTITYLAYAHDKSAAQNHRWRTQESTLHLLSLLGGWPGAFLAQQFLRHKSRKSSFRIVFFSTVALNCIVVVWLMLAEGSSLAGQAADVLNR
jgi:uncharacterized membrane protein YsdA (DUF1294 family)/cold shock CspA family protein